MIYLRVAWYYALLWIGVQAALVTLVWSLTRWLTRRGILSLIDEHSQDQVLRARREAAHYKGLWEEAVERENSLRAVVRGSIGASSAALMQLQGAAREMEENGLKVIRRKS